MKSVRLLFAMLIAACAPLSGCAVLPFVPTIAHVAPRMLFGEPDTASTQSVTRSGHAADKPDPALARAITAPPAVSGDTGVTIAQQDRVSFQPQAEGSIPLRVAAVDMVSDVKARTVGDLVTVNVVESINGESKAGTTLANQRSISGGIPNLLTGTESLAKHNPLLNLTSMINGSSNSSTTGQGDMTAADTFTATVSAIVVGINPSGTLRIQGERKLTINGEDDTLHLSGVVRPEDIDSSNYVSSAQIADLQLSIAGEGQIRDKQGAGVGSRIFDWLWLF